VAIKSLARFAHIAARPVFQSLWVGTLAFMASFLARFALTPVLGQTVPYTFFFPGIVLSAWYGGLGSGLLTTALSSIAAIYFLPLQAQGITTPIVVGWVIYVLTGSFISWLNDAFHQSEYRLQRELAAREQYQESLRKSEERLTLALEAGGGVGTWDWDLTDDRIYCNPQCARLFSVDPAHVQAGISFEEFTAHVEPEDCLLVTDRTRRAIESGGDYEAEFRLLQLDGSVRWVSTRGRCHCDHTGRPVRFPGVVFDVTQRRQSEDALLKANRELEEFAYVASHDLQEPLRMVNVYTQLMLRRLRTDDPEIKQYAAFIEQGVTRMERLILDLLAFSRIVHAEEVAIGTADLAVAFEDAVSVLGPSIDENNAVITVESLPLVRGDTAQLSQVFQNVLSNALKYRKPNGRPEIHVAAEQQGNRWTISVADNGIGFDPRYCQRIFGLFKRLHKQQYPGTGLGLAICQRIIERYDGRIWAEGRVGEGATFYFSLPRADAS
jgi:PAS domain S-box-containing protein